MSSEDVHKSCHDVLGGQSKLKTQKSVQKMSKIAIAIYFCNIHFVSLVIDDTKIYFLLLLKDVIKHL